MNDDPATNDDVTPIEPAAPPAPPDCLIPDSHTCYVVNGSMREFQAGVPITDPLDIAELVSAPGRRYRLIASADGEQTKAPSHDVPRGMS